MKKDNNLWNTDVELPEIVLEKANDAFAKIQMEETSTMTDINSYKKTNRSRTLKKFTAVAACAGLLVVGSVASAAAIRHIWDRGMQGTLQSTDEQQQKLTDQGIAKVIPEQTDYSDLAVTSNGVTVAPDTVITDDKFLYISFSVSGYSTDGTQPDFESASITAKDATSGTPMELNSTSSFYDGIVSDETGSPVYDDGSALEFDADGELISHYTDENGNLEYVITAFVQNQNDSILGKTVQVDFTNLGTVKKAEYTNALDGTWNFTIPLSSVSSDKTITVDKAVDGTPFTLKEINISPVSMKLSYHTDEKVEISEDTVGIPELMGVVLKDGTRYPYLAESGMNGYTDDTLTDAYTLRSFNRVIDVDDVAALLIMPVGSSEMVEIALP